MARRRLGRRRFLGHALVGGAGAIRSAHAASASPPGAEEAPSPRIAVGVMGLSRGRGLALQFAAQPDVEVAWVCDVDTERTGQAVRELVAAGAREPRVTGDFRRILDDDGHHAALVETALRRPLPSWADTARTLIDGLQN